MATTASDVLVREDERRLRDRLEELLPGIAAEAAENDERARLPEARLRQLHAEGFDAAALPEELGGGGASHAFFGEVVRALAEADPAVATIWTMHLGAAVGLAQLTKDTLGDHYARALLAGDRFANALSEPTSGNRFLNPQQEAAPAPGGHTLDGAKRFVSGSEIADHLLVNVAIDGVPAFFGVEPDETISVIPIWDSLGLRGTRSQLLSFRGTPLPAERRGGLPGPGHRNYVGAGLAGISLGIADAALAALVAHARSRVILGRPLAEQQWVEFAVADHHSRIEAVRAYWRQALRHADEGVPEHAGEFDRAKLLANRVAVDTAQLAVRVGGASGYLRTSPIQRHLRDAEAGQLMAYSTEVLSGVIGKQILGTENTR
ncbi:acyl-CoA/acyl-ACP dehydrogenase [Microbacterium betulae]|uniref:Acyl-CoA/acyl-ACP dehydrogenase n=1 Tax=Microbacterium betulae TaxID=2981139 RepID=A0AA97FEH8_9MICO|nr:acyl-CoA dehydrogenase family protein [Microbacterium sp. AB]WOF22121.1 acyl-CoA/acyl-ACP dehydrogenase [Microbacterium sp. AB]